MPQAKISGWKFNHPDVEEMVSATSDLNAKPPPSGMALSPRASVEQVTDNEAVRQAVLMLLSTRPGERVMRPEYGCPLHQLVFSPNDDTTAGIAIYMVRTALQRWEPRVDIVSLDAFADPLNPAELVISLKYQVRITQTTEELQVAVNLAGE